MNKNRLYASLEQKIKKSVGYRADLAVTDVRKLNKTAAHFVVSYNSTPPTAEELTDFFIRHYNAKLTPNLTTARIYKGRNLVTVVASLLKVTRELDDSRRMTPVIEGAVYLDVPLQETWEVQERNGTKVLVRKVKDDVMAIVQARRSAMMDDSPGGKTFANLATGSNLVKYLGLLDKGDKVKVYLDENDKVVDAEVMAVSDSEVKIKVGNQSKKVPRSSIIEVTQKSKEKEAAREKLAVDYYTDAYGDPKYAKDLVK